MPFPLTMIGFVGGSNVALSLIAHNLLDTFQSQKLAIRDVIISKKQYPYEFKLDSIKKVLEISPGRSFGDVASERGKFKN